MAVLFWYLSKVVFFQFPLCRFESCFWEFFLDIFYCLSGLSTKSASFFLPAPKRSWKSDEKGGTPVPLTETLKRKSFLEAELLYESLCPYVCKSQIYSTQYHTIVTLFIYQTNLLSSFLPFLFSLFWNLPHLPPFSSYSFSPFDPHICSYVSFCQYFLSIH